MKTCTKCKIEKPLGEFYKRKKANTARCKTCEKEYAEKYRQRSDVKKRKKIWARKPARKEYMKVWRENNKKSIEEYNKKYMTEYYKIPENKKRHNESSKNYYHKKMKTDSIFKLSQAIRGSTRRYLKEGKKSKKTEEILGCSVAKFKTYLADKFYEKYGYKFHWGLYAKNDQSKGWHIDHEIPLASATTEEEIYELSHYSNLQLMWHKENLSKGASLPNILM